MDFLNRILFFPLNLLPFYLITLLIAFTVHEFSHGLAAYLLGDTRARDLGRLSFNPIRHIDPMGFIFILIVGFGWAKPVMVDAYNFKDPKNDMAITAFSGPLSNLLLAFAGFLIVVPLEALYIGSSTIVIYFYTFLLYFLIPINIMLAVFNMLPLPPLDGSKVLGVALPEHLYFRMMRADRIGFFILMFLLLTNSQTNVFKYIIEVPRDAIFNAMRLLVENTYFFL